MKTWILPPRAAHRTLLVLVLGLVAGTAGCVPKPHMTLVEPPPAGMRVAIVPPANTTSAREAPDRVLSILAVELARRPGVTVIDPGRVDAALAQEPWLMMDRIPPDVVAKLGGELDADALLLGSLMAYTSRDFDGAAIPQFSLALRLVAVPGGNLLWTAVHSRDGGDGEWLFGIGRVNNLEQLATEAVREMFDTFPATGRAEGTQTLSGKVE